MLLLGYASMVMLGLLPLAATARLLGVEGEHTFLLPVPYALAVGLLIGVAVCAVFGRVLGLLRVDDAQRYARLYAQQEQPYAVRRRRRSVGGVTGRIRGGATAPFARLA